MNKKISEISHRAKFIFKLLVENYLTTGQPMGSKSISTKLNYELSPATVRNVLNEINLYGLIQRDHFSAGSLPSDFGSTRSFFSRESTVRFWFAILYSSFAGARPDR